MVTTLAGLAQAAAELAGPALLIVGEAMALAQAAEPAGRAELAALVRQGRA